MAAERSKFADAIPNRNFAISGSAMSQPAIAGFPETLPQLHKWRPRDGHTTAYTLFEYGLKRVCKEQGIDLSQQMPQTGDTQIYQELDAAPDWRTATKQVNDAALLSAQQYWQAENTWLTDL